ncbi:GNAT family N-acetyltransferase [Sphingopyxis sp. BSNA05]|uniref:GNAT family N-acetyltransferase n=1 Tax=Sphingopyxis sp. BSNA05 TaxID=1236614 RepID=UPI0020B6539E|nr:GNAT family N-acetyltransferase [Sphingopyxis sp. BSNA05]
MTAEKPKLIIRMAELEDARKISALSRKVYGKGEGYTAEEVRGQINNFADGQLVAEYEGKIVGHCATFQISEKTARAAHSWAEITGGGFAARHDPNGEILYGMEVSVDPDYRRLRIGLRFYKVRRELCQHLGLKGIIFGGRCPAMRGANANIPIRRTIWRPWLTNSSAIR